MKKLNIKEVNKKIRTLIFHIGALQGSFPKVLQDPEYSHAHLVILREILPYMVHVLKFSADMVPVINAPSVWRRKVPRIWVMSRRIRATPTILPKWR